MGIKFILSFYDKILIMIAIGIITLILLLLAYGIFVEPHRKQVRRLEIGNGLGLKIAHLSDTHLIWHTSSRRLDKFFRSMEAEKPDMILFTGDLFDEVAWARKQDMSQLAAKLKSLSAPLGKLAILGNHDFDETGSAKFVGHFLENAGFSILNNDSELRGKIAISGLDDLREGKPDFALQAAAGGDFSLLMIHEPDTILELEKPEQYDLVIAGHSHGGQIRMGPFRLKNKGSKAYDRGLYHISESTKLFVNSGIGCTFLPIRIGVIPEIVYYLL